jgi:succinoglycan biosynthesis protein ExoH
LDQRTSKTGQIDSTKKIDAVDLYTQRLSLARFVLILFVVYVHIPIEVPEFRSFDDISWVEPAYIANSTFLRFAVIILTIMSGFIMFTKKSDQKGVATIIKKVRTLLVPFLFWNIPLVLVLFVAQKMGVVSGTRLNLLTTDIKAWADAALALTRQPVNYPLYFIRDLFVISVLAVLFSRIVRANPIGFIITCAIIAEYNLDGPLILRTSMLTSFFIGAALAIYKFPLDIFDGNFNFLSILLVVGCVVQYYFPSENSAIAVTILGVITAWSFTGLVSRYSILQHISQLGSYSFPIYLLHGVILFAAISLGLRVTETPVGLVTWLFAPLLIAGLSAVLYKAFIKLMPATAAFVTGARGG